MQNHLVVIIMDSCRHDSYARAQTPNGDRLGPLERRYSYASWTSPSHQALLMGQLPHDNPKQVFASEVYKRTFAQWTDRLGTQALSFKSFVPDLCLPKVLKGLGYRTVARVSMPVLNPLAGFKRGFDDYRLMDNHNDFAGMVTEMTFPADQPMFYFLNLGETHYPYMLKNADLPLISGVHGVVRDMDKILARQDGTPQAEPEFFKREVMRDLHDQQVRCVAYLDEWLGVLFDKAPPNTHIILTADHGEMFGENDQFGHGPVMHEKCFEVPFREGRRPA